MTSVIKPNRNVTEGKLLDLAFGALPSMKTRGRRFDDIKPKSLIVFKKGQNPTFSYYLEERLRCYQPSMSVVVRCIDTDEVADLDPDGAFVIICRYLRSRQRRWISDNSRCLAGVGVLMDDDASEIILGAEAPAAYRMKLIGLHIWPLWRLGRSIDVIWASTPPLAELLASRGLAVRLMSPLPTKKDSFPRDGARKQQGELLIGFHSTGIHHSEHAFLVPVMAEILARHQNVAFEVYAENREAGLWQAAMPRGVNIRIKRMLSWPTFAQHSRDFPVDIALVPLLDAQINRVRADTKRIDISRMAAAAIFSDIDVYRLNRQVDELLVANEPTAWIDAIESLIESPSRREAARNATMAAVKQMRERNHMIPGILISGSSG